MGFVADPFCRGLLAYRRHELAEGLLSEAEVALQPAFERVCGWFASHDYATERFRDILEERVLGSPEERNAVACSAILGACQDPHRRAWLVRWAEGAGRPAEVR